VIEHASSISFQTNQWSSQAASSVEIHAWLGAGRVSAMNVGAIVLTSAAAHPQKEVTDRTLVGQQWRMGPSGAVVVLLTAKSAQQS